MNLKLVNLTKRFGDEVVLDKINLDLKDVKSLAIIGPSGGGKTTLLRILAGLEKPDAGEVIVNGKEVVFEEKALLEYRKTVGMVFQSFNLFPHMTALENLTIPLQKVHHLNRNEATTKANTLLERFGLKEHTLKKPRQLSGGQRQRVAIARALSIDPQFLLLDEPTSALDPNLTKGVIRSIEKLREENKDLILVTHEISFAKKACDYYIFIKNGKIAERGYEENIFDVETMSPRLNEFLNE